MTPFVNENETFKKDLQSNMYTGIGILSLYMLKMFMAIMTCMVHPVIDACLEDQCLPTNNKTTR